MGEGFAFFCWYRLRDQRWGPLPAMPRYTNWVWRNLPKPRRAHTSTGKP